MEVSSRHSEIYTKIKKGRKMKMRYLLLFIGLFSFVGQGYGVVARRAAVRRVGVRRTAEVRPVARRRVARRVAEVRPVVRRRAARRVAGVRWGRPYRRRPFRVAGYRYARHGYSDCGCYSCGCNDYDNYGCRSCGC